MYIPTDWPLAIKVYLPPPPPIETRTHAPDTAYSSKFNKRLSHLDIEKEEVFMTFEIIQKVYYQRMKATFLSGKA